MVEERTLPELRERIRRIERPAATAHGVLPFGITAIDRALPGGGLARGALHEILGMGGDEEDGALAAAFATGIVGRLVAQRSLMSEAMVLWCLPHIDLYGPGLTAHGLDPARLVLVRAPRDAELLWAMEEGLRAAGIVAVVGEVGALAAVASRRLQLAAERSGITALLLRRWRSTLQATLDARNRAPHQGPPSGRWSCWGRRRRKLRRVCRTRSPVRSALAGTHPSLPRGIPPGRQSSRVP